MTYHYLSRPQQFALIDMVSRGGLYRMPSGYDGSMTHSHATMLALQRRGLCTIRPRAGCMGAVDPTAHGRKVIIAKFGKAAFGASVAIVDATPKRKSRRR